MLNKARREIIHINSYYVSTPLHRELVVSLDSLGYKQLVYIPVGAIKHIDIYKPKNLENGRLIFSYCFGKISRFLWPIKMLKIWYDFKMLIKNNSCHFIHAHSLIVNGLIAYLTYRKLKIPYIVSVRDTDINFFIKNSFLFRKMGTIIMENALAVITLSPAYRDIQLSKYLPESKYKNLLNKIHVVPNGINEFWLNNRYKRININDIPVLIFVGRIIKRKNLVTLISACNYLNKNNFQVRLNVIGDGPLLEKYKQETHITQIKYYGNIHDKNKLLQLYRKSDALVVPSFTETFGLVYPEAMSQGLPILYSKGQGFDGFFPDGYVGYSVNPNDPYEIAQRIKAVLANYNYLSTNAHKNASNFSWENVSERLLNIYNGGI
ncbi:MAG: glycosyltransferase family 4 protein [Bacteroidales bacterium]